MRERLERSVFLPLLREQLYQKVALRVMPHGANLLPRGVLLYLDGWNFRRIARFAEEVVRTYILLAASRIAPEK